MLSKTTASPNGCFSNSKSSKTNAFQNDCFSKRLLLKRCATTNAHVSDCTETALDCNEVCFFQMPIFCCAWIICTNLNSVGEQSETDMHWNTVNCTTSSFWNRKPTFQPLRLSSSLKAAKWLAWRVMHQNKTFVSTPLNKVSPSHAPWISWWNCCSQLLLLSETLWPGRWTKADLSSRNSGIWKPSHISIDQSLIENPIKKWKKSISQRG